MRETSAPKRAAAPKPEATPKTKATNAVRPAAATEVKSAVRQIAYGAPVAAKKVTSNQKPSRVTREAAYGLFGPTHQRRGYTPANGSVLSGPGEIITHGPIIESQIIGSEIIVDGGKGAPGQFFPSGGDCHGCGGGGGGCVQCSLIPCPPLSLDNFEFFGGVQGFTGPKNLGSTGSFGFHEGFNWGAPVPCSGGEMGMQVGLRGVHSNFSGASFTDSSRNQLFLTGGVFRRVDWGLQGGVAIDYQADNWYTDTELVQLRGETSWVFPCAHELGFWFAASTNEDRQAAIFSGASSSQDITWEPTDLYAFFYRHRFSGFDGAAARTFAGWTEDSDGLIGGDLRIPFGCDWALEAGFTYLVPREAKTGLSGGGHEEESWNIGIAFVWYPGLRSAIGNDYFRPLFNVADNGTFMVDRQ
jgi:hypothetical protein